MPVQRQPGAVSHPRPRGTHTHTHVKWQRLQRLCIRLSSVERFGGPGSRCQLSTHQWLSSGQVITWDVSVLQPPLDRGCACVRVTARYSHWLPCIVCGTVTRVELCIDCQQAFCAPCFQLVHLRQACHAALAPSDTLGAVTALSALARGGSVEGVERASRRASVDRVAGPSFCVGWQSHRTPPLGHLVDVFC